jgi:hypothetical protein
MSAYEFTVEQRAVPGTHNHHWVAVDAADGTVIDLPQGGTGPWLGRYPEIAAHLAGKGIKVALDYARARGDTFDADHDQSVYTWTFHTEGGIVVKDIPRVISSLILQI